MASDLLTAADVARGVCRLFAQQGLVGASQRAQAAQVAPGQQVQVLLADQDGHGLHLAARLVAAQSIAADDLEDSDIPVQVRRSVQRLVQDAITADAAEDLMEP